MSETQAPHDPIEEDEDDEIQVEKLPEYPDWADNAEQRRAYVLDCLTQCGDAPGIDGRVFVGNLDLVSKWLETGAVPEEKQKRKLQAVTA